MLGDDDCLMQGYFSMLSKVIEEQNSPDLLYTSAFLYAYPGVMPGYPDGFLRSYSQSQMFRAAREPFWLDKVDAVALVHQSLNFKMRFDYNMQFSLVSRKLIQKLEEEGRFYQSPYPDYYASNAMMLKAESILVVPYPLVTIGISPKSFGFYYFNDSETKGNAFLKNLPDPEMFARLENVILPGTDMNTSWLLSMETLANNFAVQDDIHVNYQRYRMLQICAVFAGIIMDKSGSELVLKELRSRMTTLERVLLDMPLSIIAKLSAFLPKSFRNLISNRIIAITGSHLRFTSPTISGAFKTILDVFEKIPPTVKPI
jgi:hypothetical protein